MDISYIAAIHKIQDLDAALRMRMKSLWNCSVEPEFRLKSNRLFLQEKEEFLNLLNTIGGESFDRWISSEKRAAIAHRLYQIEQMTLEELEQCTDIEFLEKDYAEYNERMQEMNKPKICQPFKNPYEMPTYVEENTRPNWIRRILCKE